MFPREARADEHLDRALARRDRGFRRKCVRSGGRNQRLLVLLGDAPRRTLDERPRELDVGVLVDELVLYRLLDDDRLAEMITPPSLLDADIERALRDPEP